MIGPRYEIEIPADAKVIAPVRHAIEEQAKSLCFDETACGEIGLCVNEAMANVIRHAYHGSAGRLRIESYFDGESLHVRIRDWGVGVTPDLWAKKDKNPLEAGGLGLVCMGRLMDKVSFTPQDVGMLLEMTKRRRGVMQGPSEVSGSKV
jgi:anti-sigma regulatory factor (Ser/Thr protein kinase)